MMKWRVRASLVAACCACFAGCAGPLGGSSAPDAIEELRPANLSAQQAYDAIAIGRSTRADVQSALGPAIVIPFDSGYQVWVYRWKQAANATPAHTELVILFAPSGVVKKVRIRPSAPGER
jgi:outer membrane protein assembly factor BamE (lipoprotein component of BamABCDE complex)